MSAWSDDSSSDEERPSGLMNFPRSPLRRPRHSSPIVMSPPRISIADYFEPIPRLILPEPFLPQDHPVPNAAEQGRNSVFFPSLSTINEEGSFDVVPTGTASSVPSYDSTQKNSYIDQNTVDSEQEHIDRLVARVDLDDVELAVLKEEVEALETSEDAKEEHKKAQQKYLDLLLRSVDTAEETLDELERLKEEKEKRRIQEGIEFVALKKNTVDSSSKDRDVSFCLDPFVIEPETSSSSNSEIQVYSQSGSDSSSSSSSSSSTSSSYSSTSLSTCLSPSQDVVQADSSIWSDGYHLNFGNNFSSNNSVGNTPIRKVSFLQKNKRYFPKSLPSLLVPTGIRSGNPPKFTEFPVSYRTPNYCDCGQLEYLKCMTAWNDQTRLLAWQSRRSDVLLPGIIRDFHHPPAWFPKTKLKWTQKLQKEATEAVDRVLKKFLKNWLDSKIKWEPLRIKISREGWLGEYDLEDIPDDIADLLYFYEMHPLQEKGTFESCA